MDRTQNGRGAWISLVQHYDGPGEKERRIALATEQIKSLHYKDERTFTFETFITKLKSAYEILADNGIPKAEREKVSEMCERINSSNLAVQHAVNVARTGMNPYRIGTFYRDDFTAACNSIAESVGVANPSRRTGGGRYRISGIAGGRGRMNRGRGRGYGRGGRGRGRGRGSGNGENKCF